MIAPGSVHSRKRRKKSVMIMKKYISIMISTATVLLLLSGCGMSTVQIFNDIKGEPYTNADKYTAGDFTYDSADVDAIELCWRVGKVELVEGDGDTLSVSENGQELDLDTQMYHYLDGRTLRIQFCRSGSNVHVSNSDKHLRLELPKEIDLSIYNTAADIHAETLEQKSVFISSHSGNFDCGTLIADSVDLSSSSGNIQADWITGDSLALATSSGKVEVGNTVLSGPLSCTSVSGNVTLGEINARELAVSTTSANVDVQTVFHCPSMGVTTTSGKLSVALPEDGGRVSFATVSGELKTALPYETVGDLRVFGDGGCEINVVTTSGNLELK